MLSSLISWIMIWRRGEGVRVGGPEGWVFRWWVPCSTGIVLIDGVGVVRGVLVVVEKDWGRGK